MSSVSVDLVRPLWPCRCVEGHGQLEVRFRINGGRYPNSSAALKSRHAGKRSRVIPDRQRTHDVSLNLRAPALNQLQNRLAIRRPAHAGSRCANMASSRCVAASSRALAWV